MSTQTSVSGESMAGLRASYYLLPKSISSLTQIDFAAAPAATGVVGSLNHVNTVNPFWTGGALDWFAARYTGSLNVEQGGRYTIYLTSDDGSALYLNGRQVIANDGFHSAVEKTVTLDLPRGSHQLEIRYFEAGGTQTLRMEWAGPDTGGARRLIEGASLAQDVRPAPAPAAPPVPILTSAATTETAPQATQEPGKLGLKAEYFALSSAVRSLSAIDFNAAPVATAEVGQINWAKSNNPFWQGGPTDSFAARFTGDLVVEKAGKYTFYLRSDDGSQLFIDGKRVINNDGVHGTVQKAVTLNLSAGEHDIELRYFERSGSQTLQLDWRGPDTLYARAVVSGKHLTHEAPADAGSGGGEPVGGSTGGSTGGTTGGSTGGTAGGTTGGTTGGSTGGATGGSTGGTGTSAAKWPGLKAEYIALQAAVASLDNVDWSAVDASKTGYINALSWLRTNDSFWKDARADLFAARFTGELNVVNAGRYTLHLTSDDGAALYVDGKLVINNDGAHATTERSVTLDLTRGAHRIEVRYFENTGEQSLRLEWTGPDLSLIHI
jgi:hypothetical protein